MRICTKLLEAALQLSIVACNCLFMLARSDSGNSENIIFEPNDVIGFQNRNDDDVIVSKKKWKNIFEVMT